MGPFLFVVLFLAVAALILGLLALVLWLAFRFFRMLWRWTRSDQIILRSLILLSAAALLASPVIAYKLYERAFVLGRVPAPLEVAEVEYQLEQSWGIGGPGDNETGFVIYRLDDASARWAVDQGQNLANALPGGSEMWSATPIDDVSESDKWHPDDDEGTTRPHQPNVREYLSKYGFEIDVEPTRQMEVDRALQTPGSLYSYGRGGSVTVVDPSRRKVYFFYAG